MTVLEVRLDDMLPSSNVIKQNKINCMNLNSEKLS